MTTALTMEPVSFNFSSQDRIADFTDASSPVRTVKPLPPSPLAILISISLTLPALAAISAAMTEVMADMVSMMPRDSMRSYDADPVSAGKISSLRWL